jgi:hypothetical protein
MTIDLKLKVCALVTGIVVFQGCNPQPDQDSGAIQTLNSIEFDDSSWPESFGLGRIASQREVDSLSIAIPPSGKGLPSGEGLALRGRSIYLQKCAACHGQTGTEGPQDVLVASEPISTENYRTAKAIGNYWPYATTLFDYIRRAMPSNAPGSLSNQEAYDLIAWLLAQNKVITEDFELNSTTLPQIQMPAKVLFVEDSRISGPAPVY